jgi:hypothetical protein
MREPDSVIERIDPADLGNLESYLMPRKEIENASAAAGETASRLRAMLPDNSVAITTRVPAQTSALAFCFRGVKFARKTREGIFLRVGKGDREAECRQRASPA